MNSSVFSSAVMEVQLGCRNGARWCGRGLSGMEERARGEGGPTVEVEAVGGDLRGCSPRDGSTALGRCGGE